MKSAALITRKAQAYFAPVDRTNGTMHAFDPAAFASVPPSGWIPVGPIENLKRTPGTRIEPIRTGPSGAVALQYRSELGARVEFDFVDWGKLQMALSAGGQHMNALVGSSVAVLAQSSAAELHLESGASFLPGALIAVDVNYSGQTGYVGSGIAAAYVRNADDVHGDADYIRRVTLNVARVSAAGEGAITLQQPLLGGAPATGARAQKVLAFFDREGGSFFQEWSALFVMENESGGRVCFYYPRLQVAASVEERGMEIEAPLHVLESHASFRALPYRDACDSEQVVCYRVYYPG